MEVILQIFYSVFSGTLLAAAIPNEIYLFGCPVITLVALLPYYAVFKKINNYKIAFFSGFFQALTTHLISSFWLAYFKDFAIFTLGASALGTACIGGIFGLFLYLPYAEKKSKNQLCKNSFLVNFTDSITLKVVYFASVYTLYEWVKSSGFIGYPWGTVSSAMFRWPILMQLASVTGTYGITFLVAFFNALLFEVIQYYYDSNQYKKKTTHYFLLHQLFVFLYVLLIPVFLHGVYQYGLTRTPVKNINTVLVQQNSDPWKQETDEKSILTSEKLSQEKLDDFEADNKKAQLIVWSEGVLTHSFPGATSTYSYYPTKNPLEQYISSTNTPFIIGGSYIRNKKLKKYYNAAILFDGQGNYRGVYGKNHLVPFAEALPFMDIPAINNFFKKYIGISAGWTPGDQYVYFEIPCSTTDYYYPPIVKNINLNESYENFLKEEAKPVTVKIATPICFDDAFTDIMRPLFKNGAELFVNITDDSWSLKKSSEIQHFCIAAYRAIEYRTTLVRSANAGYSVVVDPSGKVIADLPLFEEAALAYQVPVYSRTITTYARFGNWLPYLLIVLFILYCIYVYLNFRISDYIPSHRVIKIKSNKKGKKHSKHKK